MHVVAIAEFRGSLDGEAAALASLVGATPMDVRLWLAGVLPHVVYRTADANEAHRVLLAIRARGHAAIGCDSSAIVPLARYAHGRRFRFEDAALVPHDAVPARIAYEDIAVIMVVAIRSSVVRATRERVVVQAGARSPHTELVENLKNEHAVARSLVVAGPENTTPLLFEEATAQFLGLGPAMRPTRHENFNALVEHLRTRAPHAVFDDRYATHPLSSADVTLVRDHDAAPQKQGDRMTDLAVHLLTAWLRARAGSPYRDAPAPGSRL